MVVVLGFGFGSCMTVGVAFAPQITIITASCAAYSKLIVGEKKDTQASEGEPIPDKDVTGSRFQNQQAFPRRHDTRIQQSSSVMH